jgi:hypothetical protein
VGLRDPLCIRRPVDTVRVTDGGTGARRDPEPSRALVAKAFQLYRRYPLLFLTLALGVVAPYDLIVLLARGSGPLAKNGEVGLDYLLALFLISPLISALHIQAVAEVRAGRTPRLRDIAARGLHVLPTAAATAIMTTLGITLGLVALILPGIILAFRWYVAVQAAATENEGWLPAIRRSRELTRGVYGHLFAFGLLIGIVAELPLTVARAGVTGRDTLAAAFIGGVLLHAFALAFAALATALLYFDLAARQDIGSPQRELGDVEPEGAQ